MLLATLNEKPNRERCKLPNLPNILSVDLVQENRGVYGRQSDNVIYLHCVFGISLAFCYATDQILIVFFRIINLGKYANTLTN